MVENRCIVRFRASPIGPKCPFGTPVEFEVYPGGCVALMGKSGIGKTTLSTILTGWNNASVLRKLQIQLDYCSWDPSIPTNERCGVLFQQTTLLDELTVAGNLMVALQNNNNNNNNNRSLQQTRRDRDLKIKQLLDAVGLEYDRDASKRPTELSGGMGRRASLALQLAQNKRIIVLDEPFTGLDSAAAMSVAKELIHLRQSQKTALLLISHEPHLTKVIMDDRLTQHNVFVEMKPNPDTIDDASRRLIRRQKPSLFGTSFLDRFGERLLDYVVYSLPLIALAFMACGLAISMLSADLLQRLDVSEKVLDLVDKEVRPLIKMLTGEEATALQMLGIRFKVNAMLGRTVPPAKATLFAIGLTKLFVLEVGPLLTALLLCGRIGGSYAGKVGTMQATSQNKLLWTLGINPQWWTLWPSLLAASIAAPLLTVVGTAIALGLGGCIGPKYGIGEPTQFYHDLQEALWPVLRLQALAPLWGNGNDNGTEHGGQNNDVVTSLVRALRSLSLSLDAWNVTYSNDPTWKDTFIELCTYPPIYHLIKAKVFILIIMTVAEVMARMQPNLTPRGVPSVITFSVVASGLLVILADWGFSQLWLLRH